MLPLLALSGALSFVTALDISECGKTKYCYQKPEGCTSDCEMAASWRPAGSTSVEIELSGVGNPGEEFYVAIGFSADSKMGQDYVAYCTEGKVGLAVNPQGRQQSMELTPQEVQEFVKLTESSKEGDRLNCRFNLNINIPNSYATYVPFKDIKKPLSLLFARGKTTPGKIAYHSIAHAHSDKKYDLTDNSGLQSPTNNAPGENDSRKFDDKHDDHDHKDHDHSSHAEPTPDPEGGAGALTTSLALVFAALAYFL